MKKKKKTWEILKSLWHQFSRKSKLRPGQTAPPIPKGCFSVYVGSGKERFVMKVEYANHPLFRELLEEAELEYGYDNGGPLLLPCNVETFRTVVLEMDGSDDVHQGCSFACSPSIVSSYRLLDQPFSWDDDHA